MIVELGRKSDDYEARDLNARARSIGSRRSDVARPLG